MPGMVRGHPGSADRGDQGMFSDTGILDRELLDHHRDGPLAIIGQHAPRPPEGLHRFIASAPGSQEDNGRGEMFMTQGVDEINRMNGWGHVAKTS